MSKKLEKKKEHHYVWAHYLRNWSENQRDVWYTSSKGKLASDSTKSVAKERHFYHANLIEEKQLFLLRDIIKRSPLKTEYEKVLNSILYFQRNAHRYPQNHIEAFEHNILEDSHQEIEDQNVKVLEQLKNKDLSFLRNENQAFPFYYYIGHQCTRTLSFKTKVLNALSKGNLPLEKQLYTAWKDAWWVLSYFLGGNLGDSLCKDSLKKQFNFSLLVNSTKEGFITSDEPVINIHEAVSEDKLVNLKEDEIDYYYPITPELAVVINYSRRFPDGISEISFETVQELNTKLAKHSYRHIFGKTKGLIKPYQQYVGFMAKKNRTFDE